MVSGYPEIDDRDWLKASAVFAQLTGLRKRVRELECPHAERERG